MPHGSVDLGELCSALASSRSVKGRTEADVQSDVATLLQYGGLSLQPGDIVKLEVPTKDGTRRRIDVQAGHAVFEVKLDLREGSVLVDAVEQLAGYVHTQQAQSGQRYVGVLTDGAQWRLYLPEGTGLREVGEGLLLDAGKPNVDGLRAWLDGVLATTGDLTPTPDEIEARLGAASSGFQLDDAELTLLYAGCSADPEVALKRRLWGELLTTAVGTDFADDDGLFVEHTYLSLVANLIAHAVVKIDLSVAEPASLLAGDLFVKDSQIRGVIEADFFDWPLRAAGGDRFVRTLATRLARFTWAEVEHDVLKVLYQSIISRTSRHSLGEYYTPDWLAAHVLATTVDDPLHQRVLDPACGSGTFLFHAVRIYLAAAEADGRSTADALDGVTAAVTGIDVHPVAVTLARVTYLLAIGVQRLGAERNPMLVPVYLGDSVQWSNQRQHLTAGGITVSTGDGQTMFADELRFPDALLDDATRFDQLVSALTEAATSRPPGSKVPSLTSVLKPFGVHSGDLAVLTATFAALCHLHDVGSNHIWGYYVRNLVRPLWLTRPANHVDRLVGNPPWLAYSHMTVQMKKDFKARSAGRGLWPGGVTARNQDLASYFLVRCAELYLKPGGRFAMVMPAAVLTRQQYAPFRTGRWEGPEHTGGAALDQPDDLTALKPDVFPVPACVVRGSYGSVNHHSGLPPEARRWSGRLDPEAGLAAAENITVEVVAAGVAAMTGATSPYAPRFSAGANLRPRVLVCVEPAPAPVLGSAKGLRRVRPKRTSLEKDPWKSLPGQPAAVVETQFVHEAHTGSTVVPYRLLEPWLVAVPVAKGRALAAGSDALAAYPHMNAWWARAETEWAKHNKQGSGLALIDQVNYRRSLEGQFPLLGHRVVYTASGARLAAARLADADCLVDYKLYWAAVGSADEARYLTAVLNSDVVAERVRPLQSVGQFGPRDLDKYVWSLAIPEYQPGDPVHAGLAAAAAAAEATVAALALPAQFQAARKAARAALADTGAAGDIDALVAELLGPPP